MSLLNVTVKRANYIGDQAAQFNTYVTLKLQNVKTTTLTVKGSEPIWNQDFLFETSTVHTGLLVEVWSKNIILDRAIGFQYIPLQTVPYNQYEYPTGTEQWYNIDTEQILVNGEVQGTRDATGHMLLLDLHFEIPFDVDANGVQNQNRMAYNNDYTNQEQYIENCQDYGDFGANEYSCQNQPAYGQQATSHSSLETSRQNSYERDERQYYDVNNFYNDQYQDDYPHYQNGETMEEEYDDGALFYNSRPRNASNHRVVRQLSRKNLERQNTLFDEEQYDEPLDTCSEMNYNMNYSSDYYQDGYNNGEYNFDPYGCSGNQKALPQPPMSYSQSVNDGFGHRGASLPATPNSHQRYNNRQLPKYTSPTHQPNLSRGLPKLTRQLPPSAIESAASTFSSLFGVGRNVKRSVPSVGEQETQRKSLFSLLSESKPQASQADNYATDNLSYNENYNYAYNSVESTDELMVIEQINDGDNNNLQNGRLGDRKALPNLPSYDKSSSDYDSYGYSQSHSEPFNKEIPIIDVQESLNYDDSYYGDEYYETSMYLNQHLESTLSPSPKKLKRLPSPAISMPSKTPTTPSIMTSAGAGLSSLFSSISNTLHSPATTTNTTTTSSYVSSTAQHKSISSTLSSIYTPTTYSSYALNTFSPSNTTNVASVPSYDNTSFSTSYDTNYGVSNYTSSSYLASSLIKPSITTTSSIDLNLAYSPSNSVSTYAPVTSYTSSAGYGSAIENLIPTTITSSSFLSKFDSLIPSFSSSLLGSVTTSDTSYSTYSITTTSSYAPLSTMLTTSSVYSPMTTSYSFSTNYRLPTTTADYGLTSTTAGYGLTSTTNDYGLTSTSYGLTSTSTSYELTTATSEYGVSSMLSDYTLPSTSSAYNLPPVYEPVVTDYGLSAITGKYGMTSSNNELGLNLATADYGLPPIKADTGIASIMSEYGLTSQTQEYIMTSTTNSYSAMTASYSTSLSCIPILGHSPIIEEEELESDILAEETYEDTGLAKYSLGIDDYGVHTVSSSSNLDISSASAYISPYITTTGQNITSSSYFSSISDPYYTSPFTEGLKDKIEEEYREDYEEGVEPPKVIALESDFDYTPISTAAYSVTTPAPTSTLPVDDYYYGTTFPSKLSTIPETAADIYLSSNDLQSGAECFEKQLTTPGAYDYTENENDYIASGDLKNTNLYQTNYTQQPLNYQTTTASMLTSTTTSSVAAPQPEPKKSRFGLGSLFSDGLNVIGNSVNTIKSTATNVAAGAVGVVGGVVGAAGAAASAAGAAAQSTVQSSNNNQNLVKGQNVSQYSGNTTSGPSLTTTQQGFMPQAPMKLTKQTSEIYDEQNDEFSDPYGAKQDSYYEPDYFNEEEENRYLAEHNSPDNNNYMSPTYVEHADDNSSHLHDNNNDTYGSHVGSYFDSKSKTHNNSSKLNNRNDTNNNANGNYDYHRTSYDDQMDDKTKLGLNNNSDEYYEMYEDKKQEDRHYEEEFDNEYAQDSVTMAKQLMHKQISILDDAHHQDEYMNDKNQTLQNGEQKTINDEYLDEYDEDAIMRRKSDTNGFMKKQESVMEEDLELKLLEENHKNQQQQQQQFQDHNEMGEFDQFDIEMKQKKSVTISDEEVVVHEKPREKRTAKQRWHWAYNRIVHQAQVSKL